MLVLAEDGVAIATGTMQEHPQRLDQVWWSRRFVEVLESYGLGARMQRGRRYARTGQVIEVEVSPGLIAAQVQGSRPRPYLVTVAVAVPGDEQWSSILTAMGSKVGFVARLLDDNPIFVGPGRAAAAGRSTKRGARSSRR